MGQQLPIPQAVVYEANLILHGRRIHDIREMFAGIEGLADLSSMKGDGSEARELCYLSLEMVAGEPLAEGVLVHEARRARDNPYVVIDSRRISPEDRYDPSRNVA